jgi:hypothetical protein
MGGGKFHAETLPGVLPRMVRRRQVILTDRGEVADEGRTDALRHEKICPNAVENTKCSGHLLLQATDFRV